MDVEGVLRQLEALAARESEAWAQFQRALQALANRRDDDPDGSIEEVEQARIQWAAATRDRHDLSVALSRFLLGAASQNRRLFRKPQF